MAQSPDGNGVILVGGYSATTQNYLDSILELKADGQGWVGSWTTLTAKLQYARNSHIIIPLLMAKEICGLSGIGPTTTGKKHNVISWHVRDGFSSGTEKMAT